MAGLWAQKLQELSGIPISAAQAAKMEQHWALIEQWSPRLNLTAAMAPEEAIERHFADALRVVPLLGETGPFADIGSGAGFPGLVVAIMRPSQRVYLVEPRHRRAAFLETVAARLGLSEVRVCCQKAAMAVPEPSRAVTTRATFSSLTDLAALGRWLSPQGVLIAQRTLETKIDDTDATEALRGFEGPQRHPYRLAGRVRTCDVWTWTPGGPYQE